MTSPEVLKLKMIAALVDAADVEDPKDAAQALELIKTLLAAATK